MYKGPGILLVCTLIIRVKELKSRNQKRCVKKSDLGTLSRPPHPMMSPLHVLTHLMCIR